MGFGAELDLACPRHPSRSRVQIGIDEGPMIRAPPRPLLRHAVLEHRHPRTIKPADHRLHKARPQIEARKARRGRQ